MAVNMLADGNVVGCLADGGAVFQGFFAFRNRSGTKFVPRWDWLGKLNVRAGWQNRRPPGLNFGRRDGNIVLGV